MTVVMTGCYVCDRQGEAGFSYYPNMSKIDLFVKRTQMCNPMLEKGVIYDVACELVSGSNGVEMKGVQVHEWQGGKSKDKRVHCETVKRSFD